MIPLLEALHALYAPKGQGAETPLRLTEAGLWHATPLSVLAGAVPHLVEQGLVAPGPPRVLFDAGAGDGRLLMALALGLPDVVDTRLLGLECDASLATVAGAQARRLTLAHRAERRRPRVAVGDYLEVADYVTLGVSPPEIDLVFNYPDGHERRLLAWLRGHAGPQTRLGS